MNQERLAYVNGEWLPESQARLSIFDRGFQYGDAVFDSLRTFAHKPFRLSEHIERLYLSLRYAQIEPGLAPAEMENLVWSLLDHNRHHLMADDDFSLNVTVSRGQDWNGPPSIVLFCRPIPFASFAHSYREGAHVLISSVRRVPSVSIAARAKTRSRLDLVLADLEARRLEPGAYALMLDVNGYLAEGTSSNIFLVSRDVLYTPPVENVLAGVSRAVLIELAERLKLGMIEKNLEPYDLYCADEAFLTVTSRSILPISYVNKLRIGDQIPGPVTSRLLAGWSELVGVDIVQQAFKHLNGGQ